MTITDAPWQDRILHDGVDRAGWKEARRSVIGASDAKILSKMESVDKYLRQKLSRREWSGNDATASGHRWEPMCLAWAGIPQNTALISSPDVVDWAATPDGITRLGASLAEVKVRHDREPSGPSLGEWRQIAWQFLCVPEAGDLHFIEAEVRDGELAHDEPVARIIYRGDPKVQQVTQQILPIAEDLIMRLRAALEMERMLGL